MGERAKGHAAAFLTDLVWSATFVSTRILLDDMEPAEILISRFLIGFLVLLALSPHLGRVRDRRDHVLLASAGFTGTFALYLLRTPPSSSPPRRTWP